MPKPVKSIQQIQKRYLDGMTQARQSYIDGINAVTESPMAQAASPEAEARYLQGVQQSVSSGRRRDKLMSTSLQAYKDGAIKKGADRLLSGAQAAQQKQAAILSKWQPIYQSIRDTVAAMPKGGEANAVARAAMAIRMQMAAAGK